MVLAAAVAAPAASAGAWVGGRHARSGHTAVRLGVRSGGAVVRRGAWFGDAAVCRGALVVGAECSGIATRRGLA